MPIFFVPFLLNNKKAIKPKALLTWPIHSYITNKDKLKSVLSISSIWAIKMGSLQNTVTWYNTHLARYMANNAAAFKKRISFLSRSLCVVCRPAMKVYFVRCDHILITSFGNPCPPDWDGTPYFFMWMLILRTRESKMSMGYVAVEGLPCIHNQITSQLFTTANLYT